MGSGISDAKGSWDSLFGHKDKDATNSMLNGQVVATGTPGAQVVADPTQSLDPSQLRNLKLLGGGLGAVGGAMQSQQQPQGGAQAPISFAPPQRDLSAYFLPQHSAFYGQ